MSSSLPSGSSIRAHEARVIRQAVRFFVNGRTIAAIAMSLLAFAFGCASMTPITPVPTQKVVFTAAKEINNGKALPIDVVYITYVQELRQVVRYGAEQWFEGKQREQWNQKESVSIQGGSTVTVELDPRILERTVLLVIIADFENTKDPSKQQAIIDYAGQQNETILVKESSLMPENKSLRFIE